MAAPAAAGGAGGAGGAAVAGLLRDPNFLIESVSHVFNYFIVGVHGLMPKNTESPLFRVPKNTIVMQTAATRCVSSDYDKLMASYFDSKDNLKWVFASMTGLVKDPILDTISYNVEGEEALDKIIELSDTNIRKGTTETGLQKAKNLWGVYKIEPNVGHNSSSRHFIDVITDSIKSERLTRQSHVVAEINRIYKDKLNVIFFLNCNSAIRDTNSHVSNYEIAMGHSRIETHSKSKEYTKNLPHKPGSLPSEKKAKKLVSGIYFNDKNDYKCSNLNYYRLYKPRVPEHLVNLDVDPAEEPGFYANNKSTTNKSKRKQKRKTRRRK
jgi:hypothetical protein